jgi:hypothetical protein
MDPPSPRELQGDALLHHLLEWGRAARGSGGLIFLTPSGVKFAKSNAHVHAVVETHNRPILMHLVSRWVDAGLLRYSNGKYHFTDHALREFSFRKKASFTEVQILERIRAFAKPPSLQRRKRK